MREALRETQISLAVVLNWSVFSHERYQSPSETGGVVGKNGLRQTVVFLYFNDNVDKTSFLCSVFLETQRFFKVSAVLALHLLIILAQGKKKSKKKTLTQRQRKGKENTIWNKQLSSRHSYRTTRQINRMTEFLQRFLKIRAQNLQSLLATGKTFGADRFLFFG